MRQLVWEKEISELKPVKLRVKINLVSYPARAEGLVNMRKLISIWYGFFVWFGLVDLKA